MIRSIRLNPLSVVSYGAGEHGTILVTKRFGLTEIFVVSDDVHDVAARLKGRRGLFPGIVEFELLGDQEGNYRVGGGD